jgi:excinuclease ABC subunit A
LVEHGNTVVVIEHNLDVLKTADWLIDLGPEGGGRGGELVAEGTPEQVAANPDSYTGQYLRPVLERAGRTIAPAPKRRNGSEATPPQKNGRRRRQVEVPA